jgi:hypothetical protein
VFLNEEYAPLCKYIAARQKGAKTEGTADRARNRYAVGIGVGLVLLDREKQKLVKAGKVIDEEMLLASKRAAAQAALSVLPEFDALAREAGIDA